MLSLHCLTVSILLVIVMEFVGGYIFLPQRSMLSSHKARDSSVVLKLTTTDFRTGLTFELDGQPVRLLEFLHVKPGKGAAFVRSKVQNILTGTVLEKTYRPGEKLIPAQINKQELQFSYSDPDFLIFMNLETFEQVKIGKHVMKNSHFLQQGLTCNCMLWNDQVIEIKLPNHMQFEVIEADDRDRASGGMKRAKLSCGVVLQVPAFINAGDVVVIATDDNKYVSRV